MTIPVDHGIQQRPGSQPNTPRDPNAGTRRGRRPRHRKGSLPDAVVYVLIKKIIRLFLRALSADASS